MCVKVDGDKLRRAEQSLRASLSPVRLRRPPSTVQEQVAQTDADSASATATVTVAATVVATVGATGTAAESPGAASTSRDTVSRDTASRDTASRATKSPGAASTSGLLQETLQVLPVHSHCLRSYRSYQRSSRRL
jgi:hypothetical protein